jgi:hypothetical protein
MEHSGGHQTVLRILASQPVSYTHALLAYMAAGSGQADHELREQFEQLVQELIRDGLVAYEYTADYLSYASLWLTEPGRQALESMA